VRLKHRLMPYLLRLAHDAHTRGTPLLRAMLLEFPADRACWGLDLQYMLGDALLVAPVFGGAGARVEFYVPAGRWVGLLDGKAREGPAWHSEAHGIDSLPILVRPGHAVVLAHEEERADFALAEKGFELRVNGAAHGTTVVRAGANAQEEIEIRWQDGEASLAGGQVKGTLVML
jgi:alpha-D-xyloside xylohydrolase